MSFPCTCFSHLSSHRVTLILSHFFTEAAAFRIMDPPYEVACRIELYVCKVFHFLHSSGSLSIWSQEVRLKNNKKKEPFYKSVSFSSSLLFFFVPRENHCKTLPYTYASLWKPRALYVRSGYHCIAFFPENNFFFKIRNCLTFISFPSSKGLTGTKLEVAFLAKSVSSL